MNIWNRLTGRVSTMPTATMELAEAQTEAFEESRDSAQDSQLLQELALTHSALSGISIYNMFQINPDDLVQRKGTCTYMDMYNRDDTVRNAVNFKILARLSTPWEIQAPTKEDEPRGVEMQDFIYHTLEFMRGNLTESLRQILLAIRDGYSITELVLELYDQRHRNWAGKYGLKALKTKTAADFDFDVDKFGNLKTKREHGEDGLIQGYLTGAYNRLPPDKFIIFSYMGNSGNHYGSSDLRPAYRPFKIKDGVLRFWAIALERFGMPTLYAQIKNMVNMGAEEMAEAPGGMSLSSRKRIIKVLKNLQAGTSAFVPSDVSIEKVEEMKGRAAYEAAVEYCDRSMARAILLPSLVTEEGRRSGSLSLGRQHGESFQYILEHLGNLTEEVINEQLIRRLITINYSNPQAFPVFRFAKMTADQVTFNMEVIEKAINTGIIKTDEPWIRERLEFPPNEEENRPADQVAAEPTGAVPSPIPSPEEQAALADRPSGAVLSILEGKTPGDFLLSNVVPYLAGKHLAGDFPRHESVRSYVEIMEFQAGDGEPRGRATARTAVANDLQAKESRPKTEPEGRVDFQAIQENWKDLTNWTTHRLEKLMAEIKTASLMKVQKILEGPGTAAQKAGEIDKFQLPPKSLTEFRRIMQDFYLVDYANGARDVVQEVEKGTKKKIKDLSALEDKGLSAWFQTGDVIPEEAIEELMAKIPTLRRNLPIYNRRAFTVTGVERERILAQIQNTLQTGLAHGTTNKAIMDQLAEIFTPYVQTGEISDGEVLKPYRLEALVRTNLGEAYNSGRKAAFEDPEIRSSVAAYQYSAIIDPRTTDFCESYDQFTRPTTDAIWDTIWPPNHFNCRSIIVPVVQGDQWTRTPATPNVQPQEGFKV